MYEDDLLSDNAGYSDHDLPSNDFNIDYDPSGRNDIFYNNEPRTNSVDDLADTSGDDNGRSMSLRQFCRRAKDLLQSDISDFVRFVLTGRDADDSQARIDPVFNRVTDEDPLKITRDYDSLLGVSSEIRIENSITVYPVAKSEDTLSRNVHIRYEFEPHTVGFFISSSNQRTQP